MGIIALFHFLYRRFHEPLSCVSGVCVKDLSPIPLPIPRPSPCPGLLRIVPALDGGICRIKLPAGVLTAQAIRAIAEAADRYASGILELTNRSNLQIRGVRSGFETALSRYLLAAGLGPKHPEADDVRNVLVSPAAGSDAAAVLDTQPVAAQLLALLEDQPLFHQLSPKFSLQVDGGERLAVRDHPHDLWLQAISGDFLGFNLGFAGCPTDPPLAAITVEQVVPFVEGVLRHFLAIAQPEQRRLRDLLAHQWATDFLAQVAQTLPFKLSEPQRGPAIEVLTVPPLGVWPQQNADRRMCVVGAPLGRLTTQQFMRIAELVECYGDGQQVRLTPWQGLLFPHILLEHMGQLQAQLADLGLLVDSQAPLSRIIACSGSVGCAKGLADTKADALRLAECCTNLGIQPAVHLSGCERSCAAAHVADFTLLAESEGRYGLYQKRPHDRSFGQPVASALDLAQAAQHIARLSATAGVSHA